MTTLGGIGMAMYMTMLMYLVLVEYICYAAFAGVAEQVRRRAIANTCCCEHVRNTAAANITYMKLPHIAYMITP